MGKVWEGSESLVAFRLSRPDGRMVCGEKLGWGLYLLVLQASGQVGHFSHLPKGAWLCALALPTEPQCPPVAADVAIPGLACADVCEQLQLSRCNPRDTYILREVTLAVA